MGDSDFFALAGDSAAWDWLAVKLEPTGTVAPGGRAGEMCIRDRTGVILPVPSCADQLHIDEQEQSHQHKEQGNDGKCKPEERPLDIIPILITSCHEAPPLNK